MVNAADGGGAGGTAMVIVPLLPLMLLSSDAVMITVPAEIAVSRPVVALMLAIAGLLLDQE
jgi:hypothetical protein